MSSRYYLAWRCIEDERTCRQSVLRENWEVGNPRETFDPVRDLPESDFSTRYRLSKDAFLFLCGELRQRTDLRSTRHVSLERKVLTALFFYATGSYQRPVGVAKNLSQKSCSRYLEEVTQALIHPEMLSKYIVFPQTSADRKNVSQKFYSKCRFPGVIGCVQCTHVKMYKPPAEEEHLYASRHNCHSINVQVICDSDHRILSVNPKFGGAHPDSFIWEHSGLNNYLQHLHRSGETVYLLGDSAYPQRPWLMTPFLHPLASSPRSLYNEQHAIARGAMRHTLKKLRKRWRCLGGGRAGVGVGGGGVLHYRPEKCAQIVQACCVLYNMLLEFALPEPEDDVGEDSEESEDVEDSELQEHAGADPEQDLRGTEARDRLLRTMYSEKVVDLPTG